MTSALSHEEFTLVARLAPLVSIDIIVRDANRNVLVALRTNEPAKGTYFVPGGCIRKNETINSAFERILKAEIGCYSNFDEARFLGVFQHLYPTSRSGLNGNGTHYIVLAYEVQFPNRPPILLDHQHICYRWMDEAELRSAADVHENTKAYLL